MGKVYLANSFKKYLENRKDLQAKLLKEISKHSNGGKNLIDLYSPGMDLKVLKGYLDSKRIRLVLLLKISKKIYIPILLVKKESTHGWNISKLSEKFLLSKIAKIQHEIDNELYEIYDLTV